MPRKPQVQLSDTIDIWRQKTNFLASIVGEPDNLTTNNKVDLVSAVNEVNNLISNSGGLLGALSVISGGTGSYSSLSYNSSTGVFNFNVNALSALDIPSLDASKITTGIFNPNQIPPLDGSKIATGTIDLDRLPQSVRDAAAGGGGPQDTDDLPEGTVNFYFTTSKARAALIAGTGISYNSTTGEISLASGGGAGGDLNIIPDYDNPTDRDNGWAVYSPESVYVFIDKDNNATENYFGIYSNKDPINDTISKSDTIFRVEESGNVQLGSNAILKISNLGISFPEGPGTGDTARIYVSGTEDKQLRVEVGNDNADTINLITPSDDGVKINGNTVYHEGNFSASSSSTVYMVEASIDTIQNSGVYYFNDVRYPTGIVREPDILQIFYVCKNPNNGYLPGDVIFSANSTADPQGSTEGTTIARNVLSQLIQIRIGSNGPGEFIQKNSGSGFIMNVNDWRLRMRCIWFGLDADNERTITSLRTDPSSGGGKVVITGAQYALGDY